MAVNSVTRLSSTSTLWPHLKIPTFSTPKFAIYAPVFAMANSTTTKVAPAVIVGGGRVGRVLQEMGNGQDLLVKPGSLCRLILRTTFSCARGMMILKLFLTLLLNPDGTIFFFHNGMLEPWLESKGLGDADQALAYFAVSMLGEPHIDGKTDNNPEGVTAAYGKWASAVAARLHAGCLSYKA